VLQVINVFEMERKSLELGVLSFHPDKLASSILDTRDQVTSPGQ
jgi:hypothetical protein